MSSPVSPLVSIVLISSSIQSGEVVSMPRPHHSQLSAQNKAMKEFNWFWHDLQGIPPILWNFCVCKLLFLFHCCCRRRRCCCSSVNREVCVHVFRKQVNVFLWYQFPINSFLPPSLSFSYTNSMEPRKVWRLVLFVYSRMYRVDMEKMLALGNILERTNHFPSTLYIIWFWYFLVEKYFKWKLMNTREGEEEKVRGREWVSEKISEKKKLCCLNGQPNPGNLVYISVCQPA